MLYERLLMQAHNDGIEVYERPMAGKLKGLYKDGFISIDKNLHSFIEKACILSEEIGHHHTSYGDILDQKSIDNRKQERRARVWAYEKTVPIQSFIYAHNQGIRNRYELADQLGITEEFLEAAIAYYKEKYGLFISSGKYTVCFEPLGVLEFFE